MFSFLKSTPKKNIQLKINEAAQFVEESPFHMLMHYLTSLPSISCYIFGEKLKAELARDISSKSSQNYKALQRAIENGESSLLDVKIFLLDAEDNRYELYHKNGLSTINGELKTDYCATRTSLPDEISSYSYMVAPFNIKKGFNIVHNHESEFCEEQGSSPCDLTLFNYKPFIFKHNTLNLGIFDLQNFSDAEAEFITSVSQNTLFNKALLNLTLDEIIQNTDFLDVYARASMVGNLLVVSEAIRASLKHLLFAKNHLSQVHFGDIYSDSQKTAEVFIKMIQSHKEHDLSDLYANIYKCIKNTKHFVLKLNDKEIAETASCFINELKPYFESLPGPWIITTYLQSILNDSQRQEFNKYLDHLYKEYEMQIASAAKYDFLADEEAFAYFPSSNQIALDALYKEHDSSQHLSEL